MKKNFTIPFTMLILILSLSLFFGPFSSKKTPQNDNLFEDFTNIDSEFEISKIKKDTLMHYISEVYGSNVKFYNEDENILKFDIKDDNYDLFYHRNESIFNVDSKDFTIIKDSDSKTITMILPIHNSNLVKFVNIPNEILLGIATAKNQK